MFFLYIDGGNSFMKPISILKDIKSIMIGEVAKDKKSGMKYEK